MTMNTKPCYESFLSKLGQRKKKEKKNTPSTAPQIAHKESIGLQYLLLFKKIVYFTLPTAFILFLALAFVPSTFSSKPTYTSPHSFWLCSVF